MQSCEPERLAALRSCCILDTPPESRFDRIVELAADVFDAPIALVSLVDEDRQWFKSRVGWPHAIETPRAWSFCAHVVANGRDGVLVVPDATLDPRFATSPLVTGEPGIRFYAGATLATRKGHCLGALCIIDKKPRAVFSDREVTRLKTFAHLVMDAIEAREAEQASDRRLKLLEMTETLSGIGRGRYDVAASSVVWSDEVYRIYGFDPARSETLLNDAIDLYHPEDRPLLLRNVERAISHGEGYSCQVRVIRENGDLRHVASKAVCELDSHGATIAINAIFQDVTEQVRSLEKVRRSEARYRLLAENATDGIIRSRADGVILYISPSVETLTGFSPEELLGRIGAERVHPDDVYAYAQGFDRARDQTQSLETFRYRLRHKAGHWIWLESNPRLVVGEAGESEFIDVCRDVTARVALDHELELAKHDAEAAATVKSEFLSNMSHELRTPLTSILGFSSILSKEENLSELGHRAVTRIEGSGQALLTIVNDILDFSKLEAGQVQIDPRSVDPERVFKEALGLLEPQAHAKRLTLQYATVGDIPASLLLDDARLRQVLLNLAGNAVKFTDVGLVRLTARYDSARERLRCEVLDTGPGIAADKIERLFKRFSQVDASTTRAFGGTGLGLAICKGLVDAMGGEIGMTSAPGGGAMAWFEIPSAAGRNICDVAPDALAPSGDLAGVRLLVADDNATNRELIRLLLRACDVEVTEARGGAEAVAAASEAPFDLILMDLRMPGMDGHAAAKAIRDGGGPNEGVPIIAFSADAVDGQTVRGRKALFDDYLAKPISPRSLIATCERWTGGGAPNMERRHG